MFGAIRLRSSDLVTKRRASVAPKGSGPALSRERSECIIQPLPGDRFRISAPSQSSGVTGLEEKPASQSERARRRRPDPSSFDVGARRHTSPPRVTTKFESENRRSESGERERKKRRQLISQ